MIHLGNYLTKRRKELGLTMKQVADAVGVSEATVSRWESGTIANMRRDRIQALSVILKTSPNFIMTGEMEDAGMFLSSIHNLIPMPKSKKVPLLGTIACGTPILATENIEDYVDMDNDIHADFALRCKGDSMINARIMDGDIVYIRKQNAVEKGEIAAVLIDDGLESEATLKRVYIDLDKIRLCAENPAYQDIVFFEEDMNKVRIIGKAVAFLSAVK